MENQRWWYVCRATKTMTKQNTPDNTNGNDETRQPFRPPWRLIVGLAAIAALAFVGRQHFGHG